MFQIYLQLYNTEKGSTFLHLRSFILVNVKYNIEIVKLVMDSLTGYFIG